MKLPGSGSLRRGACDDTATHGAHVRQREIANSRRVRDGFALSPRSARRELEAAGRACRSHRQLTGRALSHAERLQLSRRPQHSGADLMRRNVPSKGLP